MDSIVWAGSPWPIAQVVPVPSTGPQPPSMVELSVQRWLGGFTLSPPRVRVGEIPDGFGLALIALLALLVLAMGLQGPRNCLAQLLDLRGHSRLIGRAIARAQRSPRLVMGLVGGSVMGWTLSQLFRYASDYEGACLDVVMGSRSASSVAWAQAGLAMLTPLRDVPGFALMVPVSVLAAVLLFQRAVRPSPGPKHPSGPWETAGRWATVGWVAAALATTYRLISLATNFGLGRPLAGLVPLEVPLVPVLLGLADAVVVAWVLVELRGTSTETLDDQKLDLGAVALTIPAAFFALVLAFPGYYLVMAQVVMVSHLSYNPADNQGAVDWLRWQLGPGVAVVQAAGLALSGVLGAAAFARPRGPGLLATFGRMLRAEGGRMVGLVASASLASAFLTGLAYFLILSLPRASWVLGAADGYAHLATLPVGLVALSGLVELAERVAPPAEDAEPAEATGKPSAVGSSALAGGNRDDWLAEDAP